LSGGQSSLLALSFILTILFYKFAPIYIFDEMIRFLDLSHTANLGLMLREHFPQSQFIVISLKDGMFNNANVLYKVSYADGNSRVERITKNQL
jgi:structural maintenance of chromosome 2